MRIGLSLSDASDSAAYHPTPADGVSTLLRARYGAGRPPTDAHTLLRMRDDAATALGPVAKRLQSARDLYERALVLGVAVTRGRVRIGHFQSTAG
jgi:hypothetical protein